jgi:hypothetical protein
MRQEGRRLGLVSVLLEGRDPGAKRVLDLLTRGGERLGTLRQHVIQDANHQMMGKSQGARMEASMLTPAVVSEIGNGPQKVSQWCY